VNISVDSHMYRKYAARAHVWLNLPDVVP